MEKTKRVLAILMAVLMVATVFPMNVFAVDASNPVTLSSTTVKQGEAVYADFYSSGNGSEWVGLYYANSTPDSGTSIAWAYPSVLSSGANIACYTTWEMIDDNANADINNADAFYYQDYNEVWHLLPGEYKFIYFSDGSYTSYEDSKVAYFTVTDEVSDTPYDPGISYTPSLKVNKNTFCVGEDILVTASGSGEAWIGIHLKGDTPDSGNSFYWYNVNGSSGNNVSSTSGNEYAIQDKVAGTGSDGAFDASKGIPAGDYTIRYFGDSGYTNILFTENITIKSHGEITQTSIDKASFKNEGVVNGICKDCGNDVVKEVIGLATMELEKDVYEYTGSAIEATVIVKDAKGNVLTEGTDYKVSYKGNVNVSTDEDYAVATATFLEGCEYYKGSMSIKYNIINKHDHSFTRDVITKASFGKEGKIEKACAQCPVIDDTKTVILPSVEAVALEKNGYIYTGSALTPAAVLKDADGNVLVSGTDYTVAYANNTEKGTATATVTLKKENYEGSKELTFTIGALELDKSEYELGEAAKLSFTASAAEGEWIGVYYKSSTPAEGSPSIAWADSSAMTSGMDVANYESWTVLESGGINTGDAFSFQTSDGLWYLTPGEYKVVIFADSGYNAVQSVSFKVKEKELRNNVTVSTDKSSYSENDTINVTATNVTDMDAVAVYKKGAKLPAKKVMLSADGKVSISAKYFEAGTYTVVVLQENVLDFEVATSAEFTITRSSALNKTLTLDKTEYCGAEQIKVTATGTGKDWVGIYNTSDIPGRPETGAQQAYYWYYVNGWSKDGNLFYGIGDQVVINAEANLDARENFEHGSMAPGSYKVILFEDDEYTELSRVDIQIVGHSFEELAKTPSTCTVKGSVSYRCTVCGYEEIQELPLADHNWSDQDILVSEATCEKDAVVNNTCLTCGENEDLTVANSATGHDYKLVETKEGTCAVPGSKTYSCSNKNCEQPTKVEEVIVDHEYAEVVVREATCTAEGLKNEVCKWCSAAKTENGTAIPATGHKMVLDSTKAADCVNKGTESYKCANGCGHTETKEIPATGKHSYKDVYTKATTEKDGKIESKCEYCGKVISESAISKVTEIYLDETKFTFDNTEKKPIVIVKDSKGKSLKVNTDFTIEYKNNVAVGTGTVVVKLTGDKYEGEKTLTFTIAAAGGSDTNPSTPSDPLNPSDPSTPSDPAHKHTEVVLKAVEATYKATGLTEGKKCSVCGEILVAQKTVARKKLSKVKNLKVKSYTSTTVKLSWSKVTGADSYKVYYSTDGKKWTKVKATKNSATVKKLKSGTQYRFKVRAFAGEYYGSASSVVKKTTKVAKPVISSVKYSDKTTAVVTWKRVTNASGYVVEYSTSKKFTKKTTKKVTIKKGKTTKTTLKKLKSGKKYYVRVKAYKTVSKKKVYGSYCSAEIIRLAAPKSVTVKKASKGVTVSWKKVSDAKGYYVYRSEKKNGKWTKETKIATIKKSGTVKYTDKKATKGKTYKYTVKAYNSISAGYGKTSKSIKR